MKRGTWFPANVKPVHAGWYETRLLRSSRADKAYWDGGHWRWSTDSRSACVFQNRRWRGVLK